MKAQNLKTKAAPRPWNLQNGTVIWSAEIGHQVCDVEKMSFGINTSVSKANAELIVRAVNCHDELIEAVEALLEEKTVAHETWIEALLKRAKGAI